MKKRKFHLLFMLMGLLMLLSTGMTVSAKTVRVGGVDYRLNRRTCVAWASIDDVRGDHLPTQLYIPRKLRYDNVTYKVKGFSWSSPGEYQNYGQLKDDYVWKKKAVIPDRSRSYHARLKKITFARGVKVSHDAYDYEQLKQVVFEDPNDMGHARYYNCPKLKRLYIMPTLYKRTYYDIKNCPSLKVEIDEKNEHLSTIGNDICSKDGSKLLNVTSGKKYYKVPKGIEEISTTAFWGDTTIEKVHTGKTPIRVEGLPNLKRIKVNRTGSSYDTFYWNSVAYCPSLKRVDLPESIRYIYKEPADSEHDRETLASIKHVYLYAGELYGGALEEIPKKTTFHVKNKKVAKQLREFGFRGSIVVEKNMQ